MGLQPDLRQQEAAAPCKGNVLGGPEERRRGGADGSEPPCTPDGSLVRLLGALASHRRAGCGFDGRAAAALVLLVRSVSQFLPVVESVADSYRSFIRPNCLSSKLSDNSEKERVSSVGDSHRFSLLSVGVVSSPHFAAGQRTADLVDAGLGRVRELQPDPVGVTGGSVEHGLAVWQLGSELFH